MWQLVAVLLLAAAAWFLGRPLARYRRLCVAAAKLPGPPKPRLLLGDSRAFRDDPLAALTAYYRAHGMPCRLWMGPRLYVLLSDPDHARAVLGGGAFLDRDRYMMDVLRPYTGSGLLTARADDWKIRRKLLTKVYNAQWLQTQYAWLGRAADRLVETLRRLSTTSQEVGAEAASRQLGAVTLDMVAGSVLGQQTRATGRPEAGFVHHYMRAVQLLHYRVSNPSLLVGPLFALSKTGEEQARLVRQLHGYIDAAIDNMQHSSTLEQESHIALSWERASESGDDPDRLPGSTLELLLQMTQDRQLLRDELATLLIAGQDTTATAICFTLQLLALHPEVQEAAACDEALQRRVVRESLRLFPPSPLISRELTQDLALPGTSYVLPAGSTAVICALFTHRDPKVWPDPDEFRPDRFLEEESKDRHPFAFLPFGGGQRACIGNKYAQLQMCAVLSKLLPAFRVTTSASREQLEDLRMGMVITPRAGFQIQLQPRR